MDLNERKKILLKDVLKDFDAFCREHEIDYFISYGTLLGAVRHGGFIPWDDDIDVMMHIEDCVKFQKAWKKYGNKDKYFLQTKKTDPYLPTTFWRIRVNGTTGIERDHTYIPMHWGIPLDIFPIYNAPKNEKLIVFFNKLHFKANGLCSFAYRNYGAPRWKKKCYYYSVRLLKNAMYIISCLSKKSEVIYHPARNESARVMQREDFYPTADIKFEDLILRTPAKPDVFLSKKYGDDYMTPPPSNAREGHSSALIDLDKDYHEYMTRRG